LHTFILIYTSGLTYQTSTQDKPRAKQYMHFKVGDYS